MQNGVDKAMQEQQRQIKRQLSALLLQEHRHHSGLSCARFSGLMRDRELDAKNVASTPAAHCRVEIIGPARIEA
ncbi:MAG: hypothetical protein HY360_07120 [Verrucomicrobia bacterium]|nr:hypothetical protein [Verrucomicrobiota bacterium]